MTAESQVGPRKACQGPEKDNEVTSHRLKQWIPPNQVDQGHCYRSPVTLKTTRGPAHTDPRPPLLYNRQLLGSRKEV